MHFEAAAKQNRVLISNDQDMEIIANRWLEGGRVRAVLSSVIHLKP